MVKIWHERIDFELSSTNMVCNFVYLQRISPYLSLLVKTQNSVPIACHIGKKSTITLVYELINLRDNYLVFSGDLNFINFIIVLNYVFTANLLSSLTT